MMLDDNTYAIEETAPPGVEILGTSELLDIAESAANKMIDEEQETFHSSLASYVMNEFIINKDAKRNSLIEDKITDSLTQYNGNYSAADVARIGAEGGSQIFMNITATKCRAAASWIRDILLNPRVKPWTLRPTPKADLPREAIQAIEKSIEAEFDALLQAKADEEAQAEQAAQQSKQNPQEVQPQGQVEAKLPEPAAPQNKVEKAQDVIREINQSKRDIKDAIYEEIQKEALYNMRVMEREIDDQLLEGNFYRALSEFIDDFVVFPAAFMKGPIVTRKKRLTWVNGKPVDVYDFTFETKRISPYDIYPAPEATSCQNGSLLEHLRLSASEVYSLIGTPSYKEYRIREVLAHQTAGQPPSWMDSGIETEKADEEMRGNSFEANRNVIHGLHFFGSVPANHLIDWGMTDSGVISSDPEKMWQVEAILLNNTVVKCELNDDPLSRRPYFSAAFQTRPGSLWGRSLPELMRDIQRICNAASRALSNNMALSSGPQIEVYIDRLADQGELESMKPFKIWQLTSDPTGGSGRAINFFQPQSNAQELLTVYEKFEMRADDATGIPKYAHGNEKVGGAAETAGGLAMLLDSASKGIKDAIRNIDTGVIVPRIDLQFYMNLLNNPESNFTGDVQVDALGSNALTIKGAEQLKRNEFLQITANPIDQEIMGIEGRADLLREMANDLGFVTDIVPSRLDMKKRQQEKEKAAQAQAQAEEQARKDMEDRQDKRAFGQIEGQMTMNEGSTAQKDRVEQNKMIRHQQDLEAKYAEIESFKQENTYKAMGDAGKTQADNDTRKEMQNRELAVKLQTGSGI